MHDAFTIMLLFSDCLNKRNMNNYKKKDCTLCFEIFLKIVVLYKTSINDP